MAGHGLLGQVLLRQFDESSQQTSQVYSELEAKGQLAERRQRKIAQAKLAADGKCYYLYRAEGCFPPEINVPSDDDSGAFISRSLCFLLPQTLCWKLIFAISLRLLKSILGSQIFSVTMG